MCLSVVPWSSSIPRQFRLVVLAMSASPCGSQYTGRSRAGSKRFDPAPFLPIYSSVFDLAARPPQHSDESKKNVVMGTCASGGGSTGSGQTMGKETVQLASLLGEASHISAVLGGLTVGGGLGVGMRWRTIDFQCKRVWSSLDSESFPISVSVLHPLLVILLLLALLVARARGRGEGQDEWQPPDSLR